ncbi:MAG: NUDIX domain-containing protein [Patescibacteria group bacterium]
MRYERSAGAVIYRRHHGQDFFLLLKYPGGYWEFARGHLEKGETVRQAAHREIREEVGLVGLHFHPQFEERGHWIFTSSKWGRVSKTVHYFLARVHAYHIRLSDEHITWRWATLAQTRRLRMFPNARMVLEKADAFIRQHDA